jgi:hypothetical protein
MPLTIDYKNFVKLITDILNSDQNSSSSISFTLGNNISVNFSSSIINYGIINNSVNLSFEISLTIPLYLNNSNFYNYNKDLLQILYNLQNTGIGNISYQTSTDESYYYLKLSYQARNLNIDDLINNSKNYKDIIDDLSQTLQTLLNYVNILS